MFNRIRSKNILVLSGFAYHNKWDLPVLLLNDLHEGRPYPLPLSLSEANWLLKELAGEPDVPAIFQNYLNLIEQQGYSIAEIALMPAVSGSSCVVQLQKGFKKKQLEIEPADGVLLSIRTGLDLCLHPSWNNELTMCDWIGELSNFQSFTKLMKYSSDNRSNYQYF